LSAAILDIAALTPSHPAHGEPPYKAGWVRAGDVPAHSKSFAAATAPVNGEDYRKTKKLNWG